MDTLNERWLALQIPYDFVLVFSVWLGLFLYTCKRQCDFFRRNRHIVNVKKLQYETRKNLKREQVTFYMVRDLMHSSMVQSDDLEPVELELQDLQYLQFQINAQLTKLEFVLESKLAAQ